MDERRGVELVPGVWSRDIPIVAVPWDSSFYRRQQITAILPSWEACSASYGCGVAFLVLVIFDLKLLKTMLPGTEIWTGDLVIQNLIAFLRDVLLGTNTRSAYLLLVGFSLVLNLWTKVSALSIGVVILGPDAISLFVIVLARFHCCCTEVFVAEAVVVSFVAWIIKSVLLSWNLIQYRKFNIIQHLVLISHRKPFYDISQDSFASRCTSTATTSSVSLSTIGSLFLTQEQLFVSWWTWSSTACINPYQTRYHLIGHILCRSMQHILKLLGWKALNDHILLFFTKLVLSLKLLELCLMNLSSDAESSSLGAHAIVGGLLECLELLLVQALQQTLSSLFHFNETTLQPLPELVVLSTTYIWSMPDGMLDELLNLIYPLSFKHIFLDWFDSNHQACHVLDQDVITCDQELLLFGRLVGWAVAIGLLAKLESTVLWLVLGTLGCWGVVVQGRKELLLALSLKLLSGACFLASFPHVELLRSLLILMRELLTSKTSFGSLNLAKFLKALLVWRQIVLISQSTAIISGICSSSFIEDWSLAIQITLASNWIWRWLIALSLSCST